MAAVNVAVAVVLAEGQVLIAKRPLHKSQGGLWEFPGGKIEANETAQVALLRELQEEVGVDFSSARMTDLIELSFTYPDIQVQLDVFLLRADKSAIKATYGAEGQEVRWAAVEDLANYEFPEANQAILSALNKAIS